MNPASRKKSLKLGLPRSFTSLFGANKAPDSATQPSDSTLKSPTSENGSQSYSGHETSGETTSSATAVRRATDPEPNSSNLNSLFINNYNLHVSTPHFSFHRLSEPELEFSIKTLISDSIDKNSLPMIILSENIEYSIEGFAQLDAQNIALNANKQLQYDTIESEEIIQTNKEYNAYFKKFYGQEHFNFVGKTENLEDFIFSIKFDLNSKYICILRTKEGNVYEECDMKEVSIYKILQSINQNLNVKSLKPVWHPLASQHVAAYDKEIIKSTFTFGIIYQKFGQTNEKEILDNKENSVEFEEFLNFIGRRIKLKNFNKFRGGLDITSDDTGEETVFEEHDESQIIFHVSTLLPHSNKDQQQLERKRHIGNDRVAIVFQDEATPFSPTMIKSKLLHVFIIIQPVKIGAETKRYKISIISRKDVPYFGPFIRRPYVFKKNENLKRFILSKLINAEYASLRAPAFSQFSEKTFKQSLNKLCASLEKLTAEFISSEENERSIHNNNSNNSISPIYSGPGSSTSSLEIPGALPIGVKKPKRFSFSFLTNTADKMEKSFTSTSYDPRHRLYEESSGNEDAYNSKTNSNQKLRTIKMSTSQYLDESPKSLDSPSSFDDLQADLRIADIPKSFTDKDKAYKKPDDTKKDNNNNNNDSKNKAFEIERILKKYDTKSDKEKSLPPLKDLLHQPTRQKSMYRPEPPPKPKLRPILSEDDTILKV